MLWKHGCVLGLQVCGLGLGLDLGLGGYDLGLGLEGCGLGLGGCGLVNITASNVLRKHKTIVAASILSGVASTEPS